MRCSPRRAQRRNAPLRSAGEGRGSSILIFRFTPRIWIIAERRSSPPGVCPDTVTRPSPCFASVTREMRGRRARLACRGVRAAKRFWGGVGERCWLCSLEVSFETAVPACAEQREGIARVARIVAPVHRTARLVRRGRRGAEPYSPSASSAVSSSWAPSTASILRRIRSENRPAGSGRSVISSSDGLLASEYPSPGMCTA